MERDPHSPLWFQKPANLRRVLRGLFGACALFVVIDVAFAITGFDKHPYFRWEQWPAFHAAYGFVACVVLVLVSRFLLRPLVMRREDYYEQPGTREGGKPDA